MTDQNDKQKPLFMWKDFSLEDNPIFKALGVHDISEFEGTPREAIAKIVDINQMNNFGDQDRNLLRAIKKDGFSYIPYQIMNRQYISSDLSPDVVVESVANKLDIAAGIIHQLLRYIEVKKEEEPVKSLHTLKEHDPGLYEQLANSDWSNNPVAVELFNTWLRS